MSTKDRRDRQKQATREGILNAALEIAQTEGWSAVTVRRMSEKVEYSPPIIYQYFANKDAVLAQLQEQGFRLLAAWVQEANSKDSDATERVSLIIDAYVSFAYEQPELYQLMHGWSSAGVPLEKTLPGATQVGEVVQQCLEDWASAEKIVLPDPASAVETVWALVHGLISVEMLGRISGGQERVRQLSKQAVKDLLTAWALRDALA